MGRFHRIAIALGLVAAIAAPAMADTLKELTSKGATMEMQGQAPFEITFTPDGVFKTTQGGEGKWRIDGDKLCWSMQDVAENQCDAYPKDKKSGDSFELTNAVMGTFKVTIK